MRTRQKLRDAMTDIQFKALHKKHWYGQPFGTGALCKERFMAVLKDWTWSRNKGFALSHCLFLKKENQTVAVKQNKKQNEKKKTTKIPKNHSHLQGWSMRVMKCFLESNWRDQVQRLPQKFLGLLMIPLMKTLHLTEKEQTIKLIKWIQHPALPF